MKRRAFIKSSQPFFLFIYPSIASFAFIDISKPWRPNALLCYHKKEMAQILQKIYTVTEHGTGWQSLYAPAISGGEQFSFNGYL
jgi:hypothetical protein